jgi:type III secretion system low calcium response chaperone LcrH/SycD
MIDQQQEMIQLSKESMETLYFLAHTSYKQGKYEEAAGHFRLLTMADARSYRNWIGFGACMQMSKNYQKAIEAYEVAAALDPADPQLHIQAADCLFGLGKTKEALFAIGCAERAIKLNKPEEQDKNLLTHLALMSKAWKKRLVK